MAALGRRWVMPAEWELQKHIWMIWPPECGAHSWKTYPQNTSDQYGLAKVRETFKQTIRTVANFQPVKLIVNEEDIKEATEAVIQPQAPTPHTIDIIVGNVDDAWARDTTPTFVIDRNTNQLGAVCWKFNGWGEKVPHALDAQLGNFVASNLCKLPADRIFQSTLFHEGGNVISDGEGTIILSESVVLHQNRNPTKSRSEVENEIKQLLGATKVIWVPGLESRFDPATDGHIDVIVSFFGPAKVFVSVDPSNTDPEFSKALEANRAVLERECDALGRPFEIVDLPIVADRSLHVSDWFCPSYLNYVVLNDAVMTPIFNAPTDAYAIAAIEKAFYPRKVIAIPANCIAVGGGSFHCTTQNQVAADE
eukprot:c5247_g2_i1.p1 GENE.c5247_g2_i1~~c5247_g2_i1.p1  ORF type:complete len:365 (+),score=102.82 c5247_g2_i1:27-1121(+)